MSDTEEVQFKEESSTPMSKRAAKKLKKQLNEAEQKKNKKSEHGFVYLGHLPHGFYEDQIKKYFSQFGRVIKVRLARSKSTGNHKGYGFVEFESKEVAEIAAEAMNNYLMFNKVLKCHVIPREKLHPQTFKNARKRFVTPVASWTRSKYNRIRSSEQIKVRMKFLFFALKGLEKVNKIFVFKENERSS